MIPFSVSLQPDENAGVSLNGFLYTVAQVHSVSLSVADLVKTNLVGYFEHDLEGQNFTRAVDS